MAKDINLPSLETYEQVTGRIREVAEKAVAEAKQLPETPYEVAERLRAKVVELRRTLALAQELLADLDAKSVAEEGLSASELDQRLGIAYAVERFRDVLKAVPAPERATVDACLEDRPVVPHTVPTINGPLLAVCARPDGGVNVGPYVLDRLAVRDLSIVLANAVQGDGHG